MLQTSRFGRALALPLSLGLMLAVTAGDALAKKGGLDDSTRSDDDRGSKSGSSSSGSGSSGGGSSGGSSGGSANSGAAASGGGGREGYDRVSDTGSAPAVEVVEQKWEGSLDERTRNVRDQGDRFR